MLRGLRTLPTRLARHGASGLEVAGWLREQPQVARMFHPALPGSPGHDLWKRDFSGACGLFAFSLTPRPPAAVAAFLDALTLFGLGFSWGGFESLAIACDHQLVIRPARDYGALDAPAHRPGNADDLIADWSRLWGLCAGRRSRPLPIPISTPSWPRKACRKLPAHRRAGLRAAGQPRAPPPAPGDPGPLRRPGLRQGSIAKWTARLLALEHARVALSLDDFYLSHDARQLAREVHPMLAVRGSRHPRRAGGRGDRPTRAKGKVALPHFDKAADTRVPRGPGRRWVRRWT